MRTKSVLLALSALACGCATPRSDAARPCAALPPERKEPPQAVAQGERPVPAAAVEPDFEAFARAFVPALSDGAVDAYTLSDADIDACFTPSVASLIKSNRRSWAHGVLAILQGRLLRFKHVAPGPGYTLSREGPPAGAARVKDLHIEITVNGNPHTIVIGAMYGAGAAWKILKAEVFE